MRSPKKKPGQAEIQFDFIKSNFFRVVRYDGAFGGIAPNGSIHMSVYSERNAIPTRMIHKIENGQLGAEIPERREGRKSVVREVEIDIVMDIQQAIGLQQWLEDKINQHQKFIVQSEKPLQNGGLKSNGGKKNVSSRVKR